MCVIEVMAIVAAHQLVVKLRQKKCHSSYTTDHPCEEPINDAQRHLENRKPRLVLERGTLQLDSRENTPHRQRSLQPKKGETTSHA